MTADIVPGRDGTTGPFQKVYAQLVTSDGAIIKSVQLEENRLGNECDGSDGATDRTLTLTNTLESGNPVSIWVDGQLISQTDLTITHLSASSTVKFAVEIFDSQAIKVLYYV